VSEPAPTFEEQLAADKPHLPGVDDFDVLRSACEGCIETLEKNGRQFHSVTFQVKQDDQGKMSIVGRAIDSCGRAWSMAVEVGEEKGRKKAAHHGGKK
jgi:hypothetical protein